MLTDSENSPTVGHKPSKFKLQVRFLFFAPKVVSCLWGYGGTADAADFDVCFAEMRTAKRRECLRGNS